MALELLTLILKFVFLIFLITLPFLYDLKAKFRYYFKFFVFKALITCISVISVPFTLCQPLQITNASFVAKLLSYISRILNIRWDIIGVENLKLNESCVLIVNYQSQLDVLGISQVYPHLETSCVAIARKDIIYAGPFGLAAWLNSFILMSETELSSSKNLLSSKIKQLKHDNVSILIFPEVNNISQEKERNFQKNAFYLAVKERLPIVPVVFSNYYFLDHHQKIFDPGLITIEVMPPIRTENLSTDDVTTLIDETGNRMNNTLQKLSRKLTPETVIELRKQYKSY